MLCPPIEELKLGKDKGIEERIFYFHVNENEHFTKHLNGEEKQIKVQEQKSYIEEVVVETVILNPELHKNIHNQDPITGKIYKIEENDLKTDRTIKMRRNMQVYFFTTIDTFYQLGSLFSKDYNYLQEVDGITKSKESKKYGEKKSMLEHTYHLTLEVKYQYR